MSKVLNKSFEDWVSCPPYERSTETYKREEFGYMWPGQYKDIAVQLAWEAWLKAWILSRNGEI